MSVTCRVCGGASGTSIIVDERQFGTREPFEYSKCGECGTIQIVEIPGSLGQYYPDDYYSFGVQPKLGWKRRLQLRLAGAASRVGYEYPSRRWEAPDIIDLLPLPPARILDVGSGSGLLLRDLSAFGYKSFGADPFIPETTKREGVTLWKERLPEVRGVFDVVMSHHSLEHMPDPHEAFREVRRLLAPKGVFIVRVPVVPNFLWEEYGTDWPQLDAPRHLYTFTMQALGLLAEDHGFEVRNAVYDMTPWSIAASRAYQQGRALVDMSPEELAGSPEDVELARRANAEGRGDQVRLILTPKDAR